MKKITFLLLAFVISIFSNAQITLSHNADNIITMTNSVACQGGDNQFARVFVLDDFGVSGAFEITEGEIGIQEIDFECLVTVNVYSIDANFPTGFPGTATLLGTQAVTLPGDGGQSIVEYTFDTPVVVPSDAEIVLLEVVQSPDGVAFFPGGTANPTEDVWLWSTNCSVFEYVTAASISFPDANYYFTLTGDSVASIGDNLQQSISVYPNPASDVINVSLTNGVEVNKVTVFDILGKDTGVTLVNGQLNVSQLQKGIYLLSINTNQGTLTQKVVKR